MSSNFRQNRPAPIDKCIATGGTIHLNPELAQGSPTKQVKDSSETNQRGPVAKDKW